MVVQQTPLERKKAIPHSCRFGKREACGSRGRGAMSASELNAGARDATTGSLSCTARDPPDHAHAFHIASVDAAVGCHCASEVTAAHGALSGDVRRMLYQAGNCKGIDGAHRIYAMSSKVGMDARIAGAKRIAADTALVNRQCTQRAQRLNFRFGGKISWGRYPLKDPVRKRFDVNRAQGGIEPFNDVL